VNVLVDIWRLTELLMHVVNREVLRQYGNMSSGTLIFVLDHLRRDQQAGMNNHHIHVITSTNVCI
jgi:predicted naringenin-chalcone synthase